MNFYIKEWPDETVTLLTEFGRVVWTFASVEEALEICHDIEVCEKPKYSVNPTSSWPTRSHPGLRIMKASN
jgi:hypothetical protein